MATHSSILAWRIPMGRGAWRATVHGVAKSQTRRRDKVRHRKFGRRYKRSGDVTGTTVLLKVTYYKI